MTHLGPGRQYQSTVERYKGFGNQRPPLSVLDRVRGVIIGRRAPTAAARLILADAHIDTAMARRQAATTQLAGAEDTLESLIEDIEGLAAAGHQRSFRGQAHELVTAYLRRAELPNWKRAAHGQSTVHNYDHLLTAAGDVVGLDHYNGDARSRIVEFMPVLLGARSLARGTPGWLARQIDSGP